MIAPARLDADGLRRVVLQFRDGLRLHQEELNRLNVYPVPDGDTGTNLLLTMESVSSELETAEGMAEVCQGISRGSLMGARGNSGVIMSQVLRGLADTCSGHDEIGADEIVEALGVASDAAYRAVLRPVEGTILTVVRDSARAARDATGDGLVGVLDRAAVEADASVGRTPELLPVLRDAGVVDAGGRGFALLLHAFLAVVDGRPMPEPEVVATPELVRAHLAGDDVAGLRYEVMYLLDAHDETIDGFKEAWGAIGDSIVVVGGDGLWNCHVHTNDIGGAIEAGVEAGRPHEIRVTDLFEEVEQRDEQHWVTAELEHDGGPPPSSDVATAVVAVAVGDGVRRLLRSLGVQVVVAGGQSMNPSTAQILEAVESCAAGAVIVLPNNKNIVPVAQQVDALTERHVEVVPTTSVMQALSALVEYDPDAPVAANVASMSEAASRIRAGEVTQAVRDSVAECGPITEGQWIALDTDGVRCAVDSPLTAVAHLVDALVDDDSELVTVLVGAGADQADTERLRERLALDHPHVEAEFHEGDQPLYPYLVGVE